jgi:hypothetical protein
LKENEGHELMTTILPFTGLCSIVALLALSGVGWINRRSGSTKGIAVQE